MSSFISSFHQQPKQTISKNEFNKIYDKYGAVVYGLLLKLANHDANKASMMMKAVFVELYAQKRSDIETAQLSFPKILHVVITIAGSNGYCTTACLKAFCSVHPRATGGKLPLLPVTTGVLPPVYE